MSTTRPQCLSKKLLQSHQRIGCCRLWHPHRLRRPPSETPAPYEFNHDGVVNIEDWKLGDCELKQASLHVSGNFIILNSQAHPLHPHQRRLAHHRSGLLP